MARRARISAKPRKRTASRKSQLKTDTQSNDYDPPSQAKWATMAPYGSFVGEY